MGYNTKYSLTTHLIVGGKIAKLVDEEPLQSVIDQLRKENEWAQYSLEEDGSFNQENKWYEHESDLKEFSKKHPSVLFTLHGEGEESGDLWNKYFLNGKVQVAKAEVGIDPFNFKELK